MADFWTEHLVRGERLLWTGQPEIGRKSGISFFKHRLMFAIVAIACIWIIFFDEPPHQTGYLQQEAMREFEQVTISAWILLFPSAYISIFLTQYRYFFQLRRYRYALTDRRALIARSNGKIVATWYLDESHMPWREPDSVQFGLPAYLRKMLVYGRGRSSGKRVMSLGGFEMIPDAEKVFRLAKEAVERNTRAVEKADLP